MRNIKIKGEIIMLNIKIESILDIKEECILDIMKIINEQLRLIKLAKAKTIEFGEFKRLFNNLEDDKLALIEIRNDCSLIISTYISLM